MERLKLALRRFGKAFLAGGVASVASLVAAGVSFRSLAEARQAGLVLLVAFVTGALMGLEKALNYAPPSNP